MDRKLIVTREDCQEINDIQININSQKASDDKKYTNKIARIYVGNLPLEVTESDVRAIFAKYGSVKNVKKNGRYAYVYMTNQIEAQNAISSLHEVQWMGRKLIVTEEGSLEQK